MAVAGAGWASGAGPAGFGCTGREQGCRADVPKPPADPGWGESLRPGGAFPGAAQIGDEGSGQPKLGVRGDDQPGPAVGCGGGPDLRCGPAQGLFEQPESVFEVEAAQEGLPPAVDIGCGGTDCGGPQPHGLGVTVAGQMLDLQPDQGALDDR